MLSSDRKSGNPTQSIGFDLSGCRLNAREQLRNKLSEVVTLSGVSFSEPNTTASLQLGKVRIWDTYVGNTNMQYTIDVSPGWPELFNGCM